MSDLVLPKSHKRTLPVLEKVTEALGVPREVLASEEAILVAWNGLPRILNKIPQHLRTEQHARMCVAVAAGLFDAGINYAWNSAVLALRRRILDFGIQVIPQVLQRNFDKNSLDEMRDSELLDLSLALNLLDEDGYFFLNQCREVRNNFSSAHPPMGNLDEHEFLTFVNRCAKYALSSEVNPQGVDVQAFIKALKSGAFSESQKDKWAERIGATHDAQRDVLFGTLHGMFCDPASSQETRLNAISICEEFKERFTPSSKSTLLSRHNDYTAQGDEERQKASREFFLQLDLLPILSHAERHAMFSKACHRMREVHLEYNNFYNEQPFAEHLAQLVSQGSVPDSAQDELVYTVALCATGNQYGRATSAYDHYQKMIRGFSPKEVSILLKLPAGDSLLAKRIDEFSQCKRRFGAVVLLIDEKSVPRSSLKLFEEWRVRGA